MNGAVAREGRRLGVAYPGQRALWCRCEVEALQAARRTA